VLLLLLISTYLLIAFTLSRLAERLSIVLFSAVLLLGLGNSPLSRRRTIRLGASALAGSLAVGLMFAAFYAAIDRLDAAPFFAGHRPASTQTFQYFSFTTLTTLGYGDFTAAGNGGRAVGDARPPPRPHCKSGRHNRMDVDAMSGFIFPAGSSAIASRSAEKSITIRRVRRPCSATIRP
jgi:Ion channel